MIQRIQLFTIAMLVTCLGGCGALRSKSRLGVKETVPTIRPDSAPRELCKATLPMYQIEPPDILDIEVVRLVPRSDYRLNTTDVLRIRVRRDSIDRLAPGDMLALRVPGAPAVASLDGNFIIQSDGSISLGNPYGSVRLSGLRLDEAQKAIESQLEKQLVASNAIVAIAEAGVPVDGEFALEIDGTVDFGPPYGSVNLDGLTLEDAKKILMECFQKHFDEPNITINLLQASSLQQVVGEHLVGPDGHISLGIYGTVPVVGLTLEEASFAIEQKLSMVLDEPRVATSVLAYNSKLFYVITQGPGIGDAVFRFPVTGGETVLDALSLIQGIPPGSSHRMWIARPSPKSNEYQVLPIDWNELTSLAATTTNYQMMPGDRLYIQQDSLVAFDNNLAKLIAPLERILGFSILGAETATRLSGNVLEGGGNPRRF
ncbi:Polysaccharide biosynthesis/export protein [Novipirellula aureliae]|uniref:Polysaccharide biosynthesis/export protein n=1 Tax=Novipirellula aureliae TaxID=2527966 RepID=A0A5C6DXC5_9BACT|nr:polysaccharide biosynthesis/export family protein [Novipirellula aureliae]TWU41282.1 Polysaccharide biosynthesis/export protein [Novipirellula aureliae]